ncbi:TlpA family protein disulfide reductase [Flagellimonas nanhaiensis]|nr:TlpA disulfide reductase family protein [Allomuricauda nanhaiensis]
MKLKVYKIALLLQVSLLFIACSENNKTDTTNQRDITEINPQAEKDFKQIDSLKALFCDYPEECERYEKSSFLEKIRFEERVVKNRVRLAQNFLESYPEDRHYFEVLKFFFNMYFEPRFLKEKIPDSLTVFLEKEIPYSTPIYFERLRSLPIDKDAQNKWLKKGNELADEFIQSDAPQERKLLIEICLIARDFRQAFELYNGLYKQKEGKEAGYWEQFDKHYWEPFRLRQMDLVRRYADLPIIATYVQQLIALVSKKSPSLAQPYWESFLQMTSSDQSLDSPLGYKKINQMARANLAALKSIDYSKPLEMEFTAIDGSVIDLRKMRGKVVLVDFWSIRCPPCIREMPHVQEMYEKYQQHGFEVIGLAADNDKSKGRVLEITKKQGATWPQYLDKGKNVTVSYHSLYNINSYPTVWLLNKDGIIVDKNARGARLEPLIRKYLELDK